MHEAYWKAHAIKNQLTVWPVPQDEFENEEYWFLCHQDESVESADTQNFFGLLRAAKSGDGVRARMIVENCPSCLAVRCSTGELLTYCYWGTFLDAAMIGLVFSQPIIFEQHLYGAEFPLRNNRRYKRFTDTVNEVIEKMGPQRHLEIERKLAWEVRDEILQAPEDSLANICLTVIGQQSNLLLDYLPV